MTEVDTADVAAAVILAAGSSSRLGVPKQAFAFRGESLLRRAARAALDAGCRPVFVVTGSNAEQSRRELQVLNVIEVVNENWGDGMASSVRAGVNAVVRSGAAATSPVVLMVCDQPFVTSDVIRLLVSEHRATQAPIVASRYGGAGYGVPALFARSLFAELLSLAGAAGAKQVIERHGGEARFVDFAAGEIDVDTPEDVARLASMAS